MPCPEQKQVEQTVKHLPKKGSLVKEIAETLFNRIVLHEEIDIYW